MDQMDPLERLRETVFRAEETRREQRDLLRNAPQVAHTNRADPDIPRWVVDREDELRGLVASVERQRVELEARTQARVALVVPWLDDHLLKSHLQRLNRELESLRKTWLMEYYLARGGRRPDNWEETFQNLSTKFLEASKKEIAEWDERWVPFPWEESLPTLPPQQVLEPLQDSTEHAWEPEIIEINSTVDMSTSMLQSPRKSGRQVESVKPIDEVSDVGMLQEYPGPKEVLEYSEPDSDLQEEPQSILEQDLQEDLEQEFEDMDDLDEFDGIDEIDDDEDIEETEIIEEDIDELDDVRMTHHNTDPVAFATQIPGIVTGGEYENLLGNNDLHGNFDPIEIIESEDDLANDQAAYQVEDQVESESQRSPSPAAVELVDIEAVYDEFQDPMHLLAAQALETLSPEPIAAAAEADEAEAQEPEIIEVKSPASIEIEHNFQQPLEPQVVVMQESPDIVGTAVDTSMVDLLESESPEADPSKDTNSARGALSQQDTPKLRMDFGFDITADFDMADESASPDAEIIPSVIEPHDAPVPDEESESKTEADKSQNATPPITLAPPGFRDVSMHDMDVSFNIVPDFDSQPEKKTAPSTQGAPAVFDNAATLIRSASKLFGKSPLFGGKGPQRISHSTPAPAIADPRTLSLSAQRVFNQSPLFSGTNRAPIKRPDFSSQPVPRMDSITRAKFKMGSTEDAKFVNPVVIQAEEEKERLATPTHGPIKKRKTSKPEPKIEVKESGDEYPAVEPVASCDETPELAPDADPALRRSPRKLATTIPGARSVSPFKRSQSPSKRNPSKKTTSDSNIPTEVSAPTEETLPDPKCDEPVPMPTEGELEVDRIRTKRSSKRSAETTKVSPPKKSKQDKPKAQVRRSSRLQKK